MAMNLIQGMVLTLPSLPMQLDISYTPDVLLHAPLRESITSHAHFEEACAAGFEGCFEGLVDVDGNGEEVFVKRGYSWDEVVMFLVDVVTEELPVLCLPLAWKVGFCLGWLSALALLQPEDARRAMVVLLVLLGPGAVVNGKL